MMKELKGFAKVGLQPGEKKTVAFEIEPKAISFYNGNLDLVVEQGAYDLMVGASSQDIRLTSSFEVTENIFIE